MSTSLALWLLAELLFCLHERRLRPVPLALLLAASFFVRYDAIALCVPVAIAGFVLHPPLQALRRGLLIALLMAVPIGGWSARNVAAGIPLMPQADYGVGHLRGQGYYDWLATWTSEFYEDTLASFPFAERKYSTVRIPERVLESSPRPADLQRLLQDLSERDGEAMPAWIDREFAELAQARRRQDPVHVWLVLPLQRSASLWLAPAYSFGWRLELGTAAHLQVSEHGLAGVLAVALANPAKVAFKAAIAAYHLLLLAVFLFALWRARRSLVTAGAPLLLAFSYAAAKTVFVVLLGQADPRLSVQPYALMEVALVLMLAETLRRRRGEPNPAG